MSDAREYSQLSFYVPRVVGLGEHDSRIFGLFALLGAGVGLLGVLSFSVAQRTREIGVRSALGAQPHDIVALVLYQALWIVGIGVLVGLGAALTGVRLPSAFQYGISPHTG